MKNRSYRQFCALAVGLDVIGERWTLLIMRELLVGPRRFTDLMDGLRCISTNLLAERLKTLEQQGILRQRVLPPPAGSTVYELTARGRALEAAVLELGRWGSQFLPDSLEGVAPPSIGAFALAIKAFFHPEPAAGVHETYELRLGNEVLQVRVQDGDLTVQQGQTWKPDAVFYGEMPVFVAVFAGQIAPEEAVVDGLIRIEGDADALKRFLRLSSVPADGEPAAPGER
ncbi:MAG: transcriptional regulator [Chloroflexi bacterium]|nr:transcriptional regulator [Chloroflexota bacterium]